MSYQVTLRYDEQLIVVPARARPVGESASQIVRLSCSPRCGCGLVLSARGRDR
jgi:hypothetical protein